LAHRRHLLFEFWPTTAILFLTFGPSTPSCFLLLAHRRHLVFYFWPIDAILFLTLGAQAPGAQKWGAHLHPFFNFGPGGFALGRAKSHWLLLVIHRVHLLWFLPSCHQLLCVTSQKCVRCFCKLSVLIFLTGENYTHLDYDWQSPTLFVTESSCSTHTEFSVARASLSCLKYMHLICPMLTSWKTGTRIFFFCWCSTLN